MIRTPNRRTTNQTRQNFEEINIQDIFHIFIIQNMAYNGFVNNRRKNSWINHKKYRNIT